MVGIVKVIRWKSRGDYRDLILKPLLPIGVKVKPLKESDPRIDAIPALKPGRIQTLYPIDRSDANLLLQAAGVSIQLGPDADYGTLTAIERKRIVQHEQEEQWARDRGLAHKCKVRDGYSCQICGFCPSKMYKRINASGAVEAHHKTPFSALSLHRKHVNAEHRLSNALSCGHSKRYAHVLHLLYVPAGLADWCGGSQGSERRNMPVGLGIQISPANSELLKEYTR